MNTVRKLAREAVIFMLIGLVVGALVAFVLSERRSKGDIKRDAAKGVYAYESPSLPPGYEPDPPAVQVPLTNGVLLLVTDCNRAHPWIISQPDGASKKTLAVPAGATNGSDCVYFTDKFHDLGGYLISVPLGDENQIAIEKGYWTAYAMSRHQHLLENALWSLILGLWGFLAGLVIWLFYRLVRFAVKG
jgi:hypothetical protein